MSIKFNTDLMKEYNEKLLYNLIRAKGPLSRADLAKITGMSAASASRLVGQLISEDYVREIGTTGGSVGRKAILLDAAPDAVMAIGVSVNVPQIKVGLVNIRGDITYRCTKDNDGDRTVSDMLKSIVDAINEITDNVSEIIKKRIIGIGVSVVGPVAWPEGTVLSSPQLGWHNTPIRLRELLREDCGEFDVTVDNDVKSTMKAEQIFGESNDRNSFYMVYIGSGIGSAMCLDGRILRGSNNLFGEVGHMAIKPDGLLCDCGRRGCLQSTVCISGLERVSGKKFTDLLQSAENGDMESLKLLDEAATYLAQWIANMAIAYDPPTIILYGEMLDLCKNMFDRITERYINYLWTPGNYDLKVRKLSIKNGNVPYLAGAANVFHQFINPDVTIHT